MALFKKTKSESGLAEQWSLTLSDHIIATAWNSLSTKVAAAEVSGPIIITDAASGKNTLNLMGHGFGTTALHWHPKADVLASTGQDGKVKFWDGSTGACTHALEAGAAWVERLEWHPSGKFLATAAGKSVRIWNADGDLIREYTNHVATVLDLHWKPGSEILAVATYGGVILYDPLLQQPVTKFEWKGSPLAFVWSPNGKLLAHGNQDSTVHFWFTETSHPLQMYGFPTKVRELSFDQTSRYLATGGGAAICVWDCGGRGPEGRKPEMFMDDVAEAVLTACRWQHRGFMIVGTFADGAVRVWQPSAKGRLVGEAHFNVGEATEPQWSHDDKMLIAGSSTGEVKVWKVK